MEKEFKSVKILTDKELQEVVLSVGDSYSDKIKIPVHQVDMVIDLLKEAKEDLLKPTNFKPLGEVALESLEKLGSPKG